MIALKKKL